MRDGDRVVVEGVLLASVITDLMGQPLSVQNGHLYLFPRMTLAISFKVTAK